MKKRSILCAALLAMPIAHGADQPGRIRTAVMPQTGANVVVAEGDLEPRSIGSYSVRVYAATNPRFPHDDFVAGVIRPRDGSIEDIRFSDLDRDGSLDIIVIIRSVGTGGYLSADAFRLHGPALSLLTSVSGLSGSADAVRALEETFLSDSGAKP
jgi:Periplasmic lysozyme inhibitor of I-type lysozyme